MPIDTHNHNLYRLFLLKKSCEQYLGQQRSNLAPKCTLHKWFFKYVDLIITSDSIILLSPSFKHQQPVVSFDLMNDVAASS